MRKYYSCDFPRMVGADSLDERAELALLRKEGESMTD